MDDNSGYTYYDSSANGTQTSIPSSKTLAVPIFLAVLSFIGFVGNMCMMYAILGFKHMRTAPNILIFNLALGDLLYILIPTPIYIEHEINPISDLSSPGCKLKAYFGFVGQYASVFALAALSHERFTAIVRGMEARRHGRDSFMSSSMCVVIFVWLASIVLPAPTLFFANVSNAKQCRSTSVNTEVAIAYEIFRALTGYVIPLVTVGFYYMKIAISLFKSTKSFQNDFETAAMAHQVKVRKRLAASVLVITIFFAVCWFPYFFYNIWSLCLSGVSLFGESNTATDYLRHAGIVMPVINTCMDPWLLFIISSKHRACLFQCLRCKGGTRASDSQSSRKSAITGRTRTRTSQGTSFSRVSRL